MQILFAVLVSVNSGKILILLDGFYRPQDIVYDKLFQAHDLSLLPYDSDLEELSLPKLIYDLLRFEYLPAHPSTSFHQIRSKY